MFDCKVSAGDRYQLSQYMMRDGLTLSFLLLLLEDFLPALLIKHHCHVLPTKDKWYHMSTNLYKARKPTEDNKSDFDRHNTETFYKKICHSFTMGKTILVS
jgi:hypothetical protein